MSILVTGAAGFIGMHVARALLLRGDKVIGIDSLNDYYDVNLKKARLSELEAFENFTFQNLDIVDVGGIKNLFNQGHIHEIIHLAAQAGVRRSITHPRDYIRTNIEGFLNLLEAARACPVKHFIYASSSSVYGDSENVPYTLDADITMPVSLYAASKASGELMAKTYAHLYDMPLTGLRFFTVYGPWGRPDMAPYIFTDQILKGAAINVYNHGDHARDFTYIDDIIDGILRIVPPEKPHHRLYNIGHNSPIALLDFIKTLEAICGKRAKLNMRPRQPGDVHTTFADISALRDEYGYMPNISLQEGLENFVKWYKSYHSK